ncbi:MAG: type II secretion system protein GspM [Ottowia sp.]|uniref:type II secretion system protein GspM n=1 Tax=Ottowia sp. TaxID=1898956 RepID=UPI0039E61CF8
MSAAPAPSAARPPEGARAPSGGSGPRKAGERGGTASAAWQRMHARERRLVLAAAAVVLLALLWWLGLAPALRTLREAGGQRAALQAQAQRMQQLRLEADALKALPRMTRDEAVRALQAAARQRLGASASLGVVGDRATVTLKDAPAAALADWLADARVNARAAPVEARLTRGGGSAPGAGATWSGTLSLGLPDS